MEIRFETPPALWRQYLRGAVLGAKRFPTGGSCPRIPPASARLAHLVAKEQDLAAYRHLCCFDPSDHLPVTYPHVLATPIAAAMLVRSEFPYPLLGVVHVRQHIEAIRPIAEREAMSIHTWFGEEREAARGVEFDTHTQVHCGHEKVWSAISTALVRDPSKPRRPKTSRISEPRGLDSNEIRVPADMGRRYAAISQDYNPIHLWPATARLFGFARPIVHGMWSLARGLAAIETTLPKTAFVLDCEFRKPILLPARIRLFRYEDETGIGFSLRDAAGEKKHLECSVRPLQAR